MIRLCFLSFVGFFFLFPACQPEANHKAEKNEKTFARYSVRYLQNDRMFRSEARFSVGDSISNALAVKVDKVFFQGGPMEVKNAAKEPLLYKTERRGAFQSDLKFKYSLSQKEVATDLHLEPIESFLIKGQLSQSKGLTLVWKGLPLEENESLLLFIADNSNVVANGTIIGPTRKAEAFLGGAFLHELQTGEGKIFLVRKKKGEKTIENSICLYELEYYTRPIETEIIP